MSGQPEWIAGETAAAYADRVLQWLETWIGIWRRLYPDRPERGLRNLAHVAVWHIEMIDMHQPGDRK